MRMPTELKNIVRERSLIIGGNTRFSSEFPIGSGWYRLLLNFNLTVTVGTAAGLIDEGDLRIIRSIMFHTDTDGIIIRCPGRGLFRFAHITDGTPPIRTPLALTSGTYRVQIPLIFFNNGLARGEDTILDTSRYSVVELDIVYGTVNDLFTTPGTATISSTIDIVVEQTPFPLLDAGLPVVLPYLVNFPMVNPAVQSFVDIERSPDLALHSIYAMAADNIATGIDFSGIASDNTISRWSLQTNEGFPIQEITHQQGRGHFKSLMGLETLPVGYFVYPFIKDKSIFSAFATGDFTMLRLAWTNGALSTSGVNTMIYGFRRLLETAENIE